MAMSVGGGRANVYRTTFADQRSLEGNFDANIWAQVLDYPLRCTLGTLFRKEKGSRFSNAKFDGLFLGGDVIEQEWLVVEVARTAEDGEKQLVDREKVLSQCKIMVFAKWEGVKRRLGIRGERASGVLRELPVWGVLCQGECLRERIERAHAYLPAP